LSEIMKPIPFSSLINWMLEEYKNKGSVFGVDKDKFYHNRLNTNIELFGSNAGNPLGPAAGPNTQLAQNLVASYAAGFRFMELKTVQTLDGEDLRKCVPRPCINAQDEGYNCEWSTELTVQAAFEEYVKGWFAVHVAAKELGLSQKPDILFNMSVGYDYEGITSEKIDNYINNMMNAENTYIFKQCKEYLKENIDMFSNFKLEDIEDISPCISSSITLSTLHGCPPEEIEKIADYFLSVKNLHTYVKCNPTLLGYDFVRNILDKMGYNYISFDDTHFNQDLKFDDAVRLIKRLMKTAADKRLEMGVKITNTFPVQIKNNELPGEYMYMSGRALYPLSINVAYKLSKHFNGKLPISYSGGADYFNIKNLIAAGIRPITVATTILKPGGYARAKQMCSEIEKQLDNLPNEIDNKLLGELAEKASGDKHHVKSLREVKSRKTDSTLGLYDCYKAPCKDGGCPINQQIPEYLHLVSEHRYDDAFRVIATDNAAPSITGQICNHPCQGKCTRIDYESPLEIRNAKKLAVMHAQKNYIDNLKEIPLKTEKKAVIIGAGPAGIAAGLYLRRNGMDTTVLEKRNEPMGIVKYVIPEFRISKEAIDLDYQLAVKTGVNFEFGADEKYSISELKSKYDYVIIATGAWKEGSCPVKEGGEHLVDALEFLEESKLSNCNLNLGKTVAVIGGGDVAMDCSRAAKRNVGVEKVNIVYRRTQEFMPAEIEEQNLALQDGVEFYELMSPHSYDGKTLLVNVMELDERDKDGRRKVIATGETKRLQYDTVISAIGARVDNTHLADNGIELNDKGYARLDSNYQTDIEDVYVSGDGRSGAATIVEALADSKKIAMDILSKCGMEHDFIDYDAGIGETQIRTRKAQLRDSSCDETDCARCLSCDDICEICCEVCPNRANINIMVDNKPQIIHIDGMCNECGNCKVFCPHTGDPCKDKITLFWDMEGFTDSKNTGFVFKSESIVYIRNEDGNEFECSIDDKRIPNELRSVIEAVKNNYSYTIL
jgi:putative selenate reductase